MALTLEQVEQIARLARLELSPAELEQYREQLSAILAYADRLQAVDVSETPPTASVLPEHSALRPDAPRPGLDRSELFANAPEVEAGQFRVPPVME